MITEKLSVESILKSLKMDNEEDIKKIRKEIALKRLGLLKSIEAKTMISQNKADLIFKAIGWTSI